MTHDESELSGSELAHLVRAIEAALAVQGRSDFVAWIRGEFHMLLPHEGFVCVEIDPGGSLRLVESLHFGVSDLQLKQSIGDAACELAVGLVQSLPAGSSASHVFDAEAFHASRQALAGGLSRLFNAVVHCINFLSGASYFVVLFNVRQDRLTRHLRHFKLLSAHLKMSLASAIRPERKALILTPREREILILMGEDKSNRVISEALGISPLTLKSHVTKIYRKLDVQTRAEAVALGLAVPVTIAPKHS